MRSLVLCVIFLCSVFGACASRPTPPASPSSDGKISFGIYDMAASGPFSGLTDAFKDTNSAPVQLETRVEDVERQSPADAKKKPLSLAQTAASSVPTAEPDRRIIRNAELNIEAGDPEDFQRRITAIAESNEGFVVESQQSSSDLQSASRDIVMMSIRVPSEKFGETLEAIRSTAARVVTETVKGQDVTEEFIDIEAQLKSKKALEEQFLAIMKRANSVEDALEVQRQLADVRGEIERIEGRKRFLENQSSLSTIKIRLQTAKAFAASSTGFGTRLIEAFSSGFDVAINFVLGLITFVVAVLPFVVFIGLPSFMFFRYVLRRQTRPKSVTEIAEEEIRSS